MVPHQSVAKAATEVSSSSSASGETLARGAVAWVTTGRAAFTNAAAAGAHAPREAHIKVTRAVMMLTKMKWHAMCGSIHFGG